MSDGFSELPGVPQPPDKPLRRKRKRLAVAGLRVKKTKVYAGKGFKTSYRVSRGGRRSSGLLSKLLRRILAKAGVPLSTEAAMRKMFRKRSVGDGRNHGYTRSGKGGRTGRAGYHK